MNHIPPRIDVPWDSPQPQFDRGRAIRDVAFLAGVTGLGVYLMRRQLRARHSGNSTRR